MKALCIGVSQTGKSTFALYLALQQGKQTVIWDANEVFIDIVKSPVYSPSDLEDALRNGEPVIVYDATGIEDRHGEFIRVAAVLENYNGHCLLVDEAGDVQRATSPNLGLDRLYRRSGRRGNDIIETTHRASDIAVLNRTLTTETMIFGISRGKDVKILEDEFSEDAAQAAAKLPDYVYIHYHNRTGEWEKVDDPTEWYIDLNKLLPEKDVPKAERVPRTPIWDDKAA